MFKFNSKHKIRQKFIILNLISIFLLVFIIGLFSISHSTKILKEQAEDKMIALSSEYAFQFNTQFKSKIIVMSALESIVKSTFDTTKLYEEKTYLKEYKEFLTPIIYELAINFADVYIFFNPELINEAHDIWFIDADGDGILDRIKEAPIEFYDNDYDYKAWYYQPILQNKAIWSKPYLSTLGLPLTFVSYTKPLYKDGILIGVIGTDFIFDDMKSEIESFKIFENGYGILLDESGNFIIHPEFTDKQNLNEINNGKYKDLFDKISHDDSSILEYTWIDGEKKILSHTRLINNWTIIVTASKSDIYKDLNIFLIKVSIIVILYFILSTILVTYFSTKITTPIEEISIKINDIGNGAYDEYLSDVYLNKNDEIGILSRAIDQMQRNLQYSFDKISQQNKDLDFKVSQRTSELTAINQELQATLENLENTQSQLVEYQKLKGLGLMLGGISHKLGGPVGNSLTGISTLHLKIGDLSSKIKNNKLSKSHLINTLDEMSELADISTENLLTANYLLRSLKQVNADYKENSSLTVSFDLIKTIEGTLFYLNDSLIEKNITCKIINNEPINIDFYPKYFSDLIINLINFSILYNMKDSENGDIEIEISKLDYIVTIVYKDSGPKISDDLIDDLFNPFTVSRFTQKSTGMELFTVYHLVRDVLNGSIIYDSNEDFFKITFDLNNLQT